MESIEYWKAKLKTAGYIATDQDVQAIRAAIVLEKPLLIEGPPGVGKTAISHALAKLYGQKLLRIQCYEGIDASQLLYEYNYPKQLLMISMLKDRIHEKVSGQSIEEAIETLDKENAFWGDRFLIKRPVLQALMPENGERQVLLIDEVDKTEKDAEAFLLEVLSEYTLSIPEFGTIKADIKPIVVLTSNRTRDITEALRRRCVYLYLDYPSESTEREILKLHAPQAEEEYMIRVVGAIQEIRRLPLKYIPAVSETIECLKLLMAAGGEKIGLSNLVIKFPEDQKVLKESGILI